MVHGIVSCLLHSQHSQSQDTFPSSTDDSTDDYGQLISSQKKMLLKGHLKMLI